MMSWIVLLFIVLLHFQNKHDILQDNSNIIQHNTNIFEYNLLQYV